MYWALGKHAGLQTISHLLFKFELPTKGPDRAKASRACVLWARAEHCAELCVEHGVEGTNVPRTVVHLVPWPN